MAELGRLLVELLETLDVAGLEKRGVALLELGEGLEVAGAEHVLGVDAIAGQVAVDELRLREDGLDFGGEEKVEHFLNDGMTKFPKLTEFYRKGREASVDASRSTSNCGHPYLIP
ncbi:MAG: hypothetical protein WDO13_03255 [Verrucomicrobiota bacterium]